jgi:hypothetical protein
MTRALLEAGSYSPAVGRVETMPELQQFAFFAHVIGEDEKFEDLFCINCHHMEMLVASHFLYEMCSFWLYFGFRVHEHDEGLRLRYNERIPRWLTESDLQL